MAKVLRCSNLVKGCSFEARGTEEEILQKGLPTPGRPMGCRSPLSSWPPSKERSANEPGRAS